MAISSELGVLSKLPREIRDRIYGFALCLDIESSTNYRPISGAAILRTSQRIYDEAIIILYQVNTFQIWIDKDYCHPDNISIMETRGFKISFTDHAMYLPPPCNQGIQIPKNMIRHLQKVTILVGAKAGISEIDIVPTTDQSLQGPERPSFRTVLHMVQEVCKLLSECDRIHIFHFIAYTNERTPGSLDQVIEPVTQLRDIQISDYDICPLVPTRRDTFQLKDSYVDYLDLVLAMPKGTKTPKYRPYEKGGLPEERDSIFTTPALSLRPWENIDFNLDDMDDIEEAEYGEYGAHYLPESSHVFHGCSGMGVLAPGPVPENYTEVGWGGFGNMPLHPGAVRDYMSQIMHSM